MSLPPEVASWPVLLGVLAIFLAAGTVKGGLGFGAPLASMSVLPLLIPIDLALAINAVLLLTTNAVQFAGAGDMLPTLRRFSPVIAGMMLGVPLASLFVARVDADILALVMGVGVCGFSVLTASGASMSVPPEREARVGVLTGIGSGLAGGLTAVPGPVLVAYLVGIGVERRLMLSALGFLLLASGLLVSSAFMAVGMLNVPRITLALLCLAPTLAGMWLGNAVFERMKASAFRRVVLLALFLLGLNLIVRSLLV